MRAVAREFNLSETAFVTPDAWGRWHLRLFTPEVDVALCGPATLAAAHLLWERGLSLTGGRLEFLTASGTLRAEQRKAGDRHKESDRPTSRALTQPVDQTKGGRSPIQHSP